MNFNLKEISWQEAEALEPGTKLFVGQTREKAVEIEKNQKRSNLCWDLNQNLLEGSEHLRALNLIPYIPTPDAVDISWEEAVVRWAKGILNEWRDGAEWRLTACQPEEGCDYRIPACPPAKQKLTIEVDAGVEVPGEFRIIGAENGWSIKGKVIHREEK